MKARNSLIVRYSEERDLEIRIRIRKKNRMVKIYFLKLPANRLWLTSKSCSWFNKVVFRRPSIKQTA